MFFPSDGELGSEKSNCLHVGFMWAVFKTLVAWWLPSGKHTKNYGKFENHRFHGKIHYKWWLSIVMLNYQRVVGGLYYPSYIGDCNTPQTGNPYFDQPGLNGMTEGSWTLLMWFLCGRRLRINHLQWLLNRWRNKKTLKIGASLLGLRHRDKKKIETCFPRCYGYLWMVMSL